MCVHRVFYYGNPKTGIATVVIYMPDRANRTEKRYADRGTSSVTGCSSGGSRILGLCMPGM